MPPQPADAVAAPTEVTPVAPEADAPATGSDRFRPDIEGLRAIAVVAVVLFHAGVPGFGGGYVGVDVFFVISGFLITGLLVRELDTTGRIGLAAFYARRARRILPSAVVVVVATVAATAVLVPERAAATARDGLASVLQVANWWLLSFGTQDLGADVAHSPLKHYWSLAVEEQFYFVWPIVLFIVGAWSKRPRRAFGIAIVVLGLASFTSSVHYTSKGRTHAAVSAHAYYYPWNRVWELLVGAGLAVIGTSVMRIPSSARAALGWGGLGGIVVAAVAFSDRSAFPGSIAALPVLFGALLCITILGIPFGLKNFSMAKLALFPFDYSVQRKGEPGPNEAPLSSDD